MTSNPGLGRAGRGRGPACGGGRCPDGTPARWQRAGSSVQLSGKNSRQESGWLLPAASSARCRLTANWQLAVLPSAPQYWRCTPAECWPALGKLVSSEDPVGPAGPSPSSWRVLPGSVSADHGLWPTKWCRSWSLSPSRVAIGSTLLRSPSSKSPRTYTPAHRRRSERPNPAVSLPRKPSSRSSNRRSSRACIHHPAAVPSQTQAST